MRIGAYLLAGDPAWVADSVASYYDSVSHIVVSYDRDNLSWSGVELEVPETLRRIREIDRDGKVIEFADAYSDPSRPALDLETEQRQAALDLVSADVDWVLQLDSDEVMASPTRFLECLRHAEDAGAQALDYPLRYLYQRGADGRFLEVTTRLWRRRAGFPGQVAVRAGTRLRHCRQTDAPTYRVDVSHRNTDPWHSRDARVDEVVHQDDANVHFWWVRTEEQMLHKARISGHAGVYNSDAELEFWQWSARHPAIAVVTTPLRRNPFHRLRLVDAPTGMRSRDWYEVPAREDRRGPQRPGATR